MIKRFSLPIIILLTFLLVIPAMRADEGMWLLTHLDKLNLKELKARGLKLTASEIFNAKAVSLKDAIVQLGGGTGEFVSAKGLMLTNHHVAYGALQSNSTPEKDYIKNGFHAATLEEELPAKNMTASFVVEMRDVTADLLKDIAANASDAERDTAISRQSRDLIKAAIGDDKNLRANVVEMNGGLQHMLFVSRVLRDVRLVYAPPLGIGNFGGEVDNWMWPRHTGDFAFLRAYVGKDGSSAEYSKENVPFTPKAFLKISARGVKANDFVMIMGYPGRTQRYRTSFDIRFDQEVNFPLLTKLMKASIDALQTMQKKDKAAEIKYAGRVKGLLNGYKNRLGMIEGFGKLNVVGIKQKEETAYKAWLAKTPAMETKYGDILPKLQTIFDEMKGLAPKAISLSWLMRSSQLLAQVYLIARWQLEHGKPDEQREEGFREKDFSSIKSRVLQPVSDEALDRVTLLNTMNNSGDIPLNERLTSFASISNRMTGDELQERFKGTVANWYSSSLMSKDAREKLLTMKKEEFDAVQDPLIDFAKTLAYESSTFMGRYNELTTQIDKLRTRYIEALAAWKNSYLYPDANRTLRLTYGTVKGMAPRDAVSYAPTTRLAGIVEKATNEEPFDAPKKLLELAEKKEFGDYAEKTTSDVQVAFLSDCDITGGNSGSPTLNGKGELVGCAFDGVWEGITSDYYVDQATARTISVESRYILFVLDKFSGAKNVLDELTIVK